MLIAAEKGARLIVSVGSHFNLVEFLDKNRAGMSSTFLTRLRIGEILVDAKGVSRLTTRARVVAGCCSCSPWASSRSWPSSRSRRACATWPTCCG